MTGWLLRRFGQMIIVILGVVSLAFLLSYVVPGDPARLVAGPNASPQAVASIARQLGLDRSVWSQYVTVTGVSPSTSGTCRRTRPICSGSIFSITVPRYFP